MFGFTCNLRAIYMKVDYQQPLDTAEDIFKAGKTLSVIASPFWKNLLMASENVWHRKLNTTAKLYGPAEFNDNMEAVIFDGRYVNAIGPRMFKGWLLGKSKEFL